MNFFELFIGSFEKKAGHLSLIKDGAYNRLMRLYYTNEGPLKAIDGGPADAKRICELARAHTPAEKTAVREVLAEFFVWVDGEGFRLERGDEEVARYRDRSEKAKRAASVSVAVRQANAQANAKTSAQTSARTAAGTGDERSLAPGSTPQSSVTSPHTSDPSTNISHVPPSGETPGAAGAICLAMRELGVMAQPSDPRILALVARGATPALLADACRHAKATRTAPGAMPPGYVFKVAEGWLDAPATAPARAPADVASEAYKLAQKDAQEGANAAH